jgi:hypothetical protein
MPDLVGHSGRSEWREAQSPLLSHGGEITVFTASWEFNPESELEMLNQNQKLQRPARAVASHPATKVKVRRALASPAVRSLQAAGARQERPGPRSGPSGHQATSSKPSVPRPGGAGVCCE